MTTNRPASGGEGLGDKVRRFLGGDADPGDEQRTEQGDRRAAEPIDPRVAGPQPPLPPSEYGDVPPNRRPPAGPSPGSGRPGPGRPRPGGPWNPGGPSDPRGPVPDPRAREVDQPAPDGQSPTLRGPALDAMPGGGDPPDPEQAGLLRDSDSLRSQWQQVQGTFVDDPQRAVREAGALVDRALEEIRSALGNSGGDGSSTEDLRVAFQRYRKFFHRLLSA